MNQMKLLLVLFLLPCTFGCTGAGASKENNSQPNATKGYSALRQHTFSESGADLDPDISPDGMTLIFATSHHSKNLDIYTKSLNGRTTRQVTSSSSEERFPCFSPRNPSTIAFCSNINGEWNVFVIHDYINTPERWVRISEPGVNAIHPSWSPDGTKIVYSSSSSDLSKGNWQLKVYDLTIKTHFVLPIDGLLPEWNPIEGDNRIVFQRMQHRDKWYSGIWTITFKNNEAKLPTEIVSSTRWAAINPSWSKKGDTIAFATVAKSLSAKNRIEQADDIWMVKDDGSHLTQITNDPAPDWLPVWNKDGSLIFCSKRDNHQNIWSLKPQVTK